MTDLLTETERRTMTTILIDDLGQSPVEAGRLVDILQSLIIIRTLPGIDVDNDRVTPAAAREAFAPPVGRRGFLTALDELSAKWSAIGSRGRRAVGSAAYTFAHEQRVGMSGYPGSVSCEDYAEPSFFSALGAAFGHNPEMAEQSFEALLKLLREIAVAAADDVRNQPDNDRHRGETRVNFLAHVLRLLPLKATPTRHVDTPTGLFCATALGALDRAKNWPIGREGSPVNFRKIFSAAIAQAFGE